jgi:outer membrane protein assembly factor BamB
MSTAQGARRTLSRRALLRAGGLAGAALAAPRALFALGAGEDSWPMAAHDLAASRSSLRAEPDGLELRFRLDLAGGVPGGPAVWAQTIFAASLGGEVVAADLHSGSERWRRALGTASYAGDRALGFFGGPAVISGRVLVASDRVRCLHAATGQTLWESAPLRTDESDDYFWGPPVAAAGLVLVGSGSGSELPTARGRVSAYRLHDGTLAWTTATVPEGGNGGGVLAPVSVDLSRGLVLAATGAPYQAVEGDNPGTCSLLVLRLSDGKPIFVDQVHAHDERGLDLNSAPILAGRVVAVVGKDGVRAWDAGSGERLWHTQLTPESAAPDGHADPTSGPEGGPLAWDGRRLYALSNDAAEFEVVAAALSPDTGRVLWQRRLPAWSFAAPAASPGAIFFATFDGTLYGLRSDDGGALLQSSVPEMCACAPSLAEDSLLLGTGAGAFLPGTGLYCLG